MKPCECAKQWLADMVEEAMRRRPKDAGADWVLQWLLTHSNLSMARVRGIMEFELQNRENDE